MSIWQTIREAISPHPPPPVVDMNAPCYWQVDIHSHLLPGVDDGIAEPEQALECLRRLAKWGIKKVITTPHVNRDFYPNESIILQSGRYTLQDLADEDGLNIQVEVAAEYLLDEFFVELLNADDLLTFGGSARYLLIELGWVAAPRQLDELLFRIRTRGYTPILAHPERYLYYYNDAAALEHLRESGCLFQLNWGSITRRYGERVQAQAQLLLRKGWVDFIGSDIHRTADLSALETLFISQNYTLLQKQPLQNHTLL